MMNRPFHFLLLGILLFLASCGEVKPLEPEEVLKRSIIRSSAVESASVSASVFILLKGYSSFSGSAVVQGVLRGSGGWSADISFQGRDSNGTGAPESGKIRTISVDGSQIFLKPESLQGPMLELYAKSLTGSLNGWWVTGQPASLPLGGRRTLSPADLSETASMFTIISASGPLKISDRKKAYRIDVLLSDDAVRTLFADSAKENTSIRGTLWINALDFTLLRAEWNLRDLMTVFGPADLSVDVTLSDINRPTEISLPTGSSSKLPLNGAFATISR